MLQGNIILHGHCLREGMLKKTKSNKRTLFVEGYGKMGFLFQKKRLSQKTILTAENAKLTFAKATVGNKSAKYAKLKYNYSALCELCEIPWRPLKLMDFDF
jgi:hypothetical protein